MTRRQAREHLFLMLFRYEFHKGDELLEQADLYLEPLQNISEDDFELFDRKMKSLKPEDLESLKDRYNNIVDKLPEIDATLSEISSGWTLSRMGKVDLTVMRIAIYEIKYDEDIPGEVSINEAVEIAKKFGEESSGSFVNGVLAKLLR